MGIGKRIKEARLNKGLTQEGLAKLVGLTKGAIANYENDVSHPKAAIIYALMDVLEVEPNFLFQDCVKILQQKKESPIERDLLESFHQLNQEGQTLVNKYAGDLVATGHYKISPLKSKTG